MRRCLNAGIFAISIVMLCIAVRQISNKYHFSDILLTEAEILQIQNSRKESSKELLTGISINNFPLIYDETQNGWFYTSSDRKQFPELPIDFSASENGVRIAVPAQADPGHSVPMIAYTDEEYKTYSLVFTSLPLITIDCETTDIPYNSSLPVRFTLYENNAEARQPVIYSDGTIHLRGNGTRLYPKKPYRITLTAQSIGNSLRENRTSLLGMRKDGDWLLNPAYVDQERIRNVFSSNLWFNSCAGDNIFHIKNGMEYRFVELFLNQQYWGLYALGYPADARQMNISPGIDGEYEEFLFKQKYWGPVAPDYSDLKRYLPLQFETDEANEDYGFSILKMYFEHIDSGIPNGLYNNDETNAIDIWLFTKMIQAMDSVSYPGKMNNIIYTIKVLDGERKIIYTPWDMDATWGNSFNFRQFGNAIIYQLDPTDNSLEMTLNPVSVLLGREDNSRISQKIRQRYTELRSDKWSDEAIDAMLDEFEKEIYDSGAYIRDMERWPDGAYQDPDLGLSVFRTYVHDRLISMDDYIERL